MENIERDQSQQNVQGDKLYKTVMGNAMGIAPMGYVFSITPNMIANTIINWLEYKGVDMTDIYVTCKFVSQKNYLNKKINEEIEKTNLPFYVAIMHKFKKDKKERNGNENNALHNIMKHLQNDKDRSQFKANIPDKLNGAINVLQGISDTRNTVKWYSAKNNIGMVILNSDAVLALMFKMNYFQEYPKYVFDVANISTLQKDISRFRNQNRRLGDIPMRVIVSQSRPKGRPDNNFNDFENCLR